MAAISTNDNSEIDYPRKLLNVSGGLPWRISTDMHVNLTARTLHLRLISSMYEACSFLKISRLDIDMRVERSSIA
jgi:hypothetical protein